MQKIILSMMLSMTCINQVTAEPFIPRTDSQVLEKLSSKLSKPLSKELKVLRIELSKNPKNKDLVVKFTKQCIELSRRESDPRYLGYAEAVIKPWLGKSSSYPDILILEAIIKQSFHNFQGALEELSKVLKEDPTNSQAWLTKAQIHTTRGEYLEAKQSCTHLLRLANQLISFACISNVSSLSGDSEKSYSLLNHVVNDSVNSNISTEEKTWAFTLLGEIALRMGDNVSGEKHFKEALNQNTEDNYLLAVYSDFLLNENRPQEIINLLQNKTQVDALFLRLLLAEKKLQSPNFEKHFIDLKNRFYANKRRGDSVHLREEAIFTLKLLNNSKEGLKLAQKNWTLQKEPIDTQIFLESAIAANNKQVAKPVLEFLEKTKLEDKYIEKLVQELEGI